MSVLHDKHLQPLHSPVMRTRRAALCLAAVLLLAGGALHAGTPGEAKVGQMLRDAPLHGLNGPDRRFSAYRGRPLLINVWASWCGPCRDEMASLERLAWIEQPVPFAVIGISTDDEADAARVFLKRANSTFNHYIDKNLELENLLGANRLPLTILVAADGHVLHKVYGAQQWDSPASLKLIHTMFSAATRLPDRIIKGDGK
jgi:thiol-disulfide isomerase/thioredoxin